MRRCVVALLLAAGLAANAAVVRPSPNFSWEGASKTSLRSMRGQPVVLIISRSARGRAFKKQIRNLEEIYQQFASRKVVFVAAIQEGEPMVRSNIPFAIASDAGRVAGEFGVEGKFSIIIIGKDGNIDLQTDRVIPASRVREVILNSFENQAAERKN